jgi:DNA-binding LacI/PurR family transcriptional regulator
LEFAQSKGIRLVIQDLVQENEALFMAGEEHENMGYTKTRILLAERPNMDGLIVYPDSIARGVACALLESGATGRTIHAAFHRNREIPFFCPLPVCWIESSASDVASALFEKVHNPNSSLSKSSLLTFHKTETPKQR